jgi:hypothetical protein
MQTGMVSKSKMITHAAAKEVEDCLGDHTKDVLLHTWTGGIVFSGFCVSSILFFIFMQLLIA